MKENESVKLFNLAVDAMWNYLHNRGWHKQEDGYYGYKGFVWQQDIKDKTLQEAFGIQSAADFGQ